VGLRNFKTLGPEDLRQIRELREAGEYVWIDLDLQTTPKQEIGEALGIPERIPDRALDVLCDFGAVQVGHKLHADSIHVVFPYHCIRNPDAAVELRAREIEPLPVHLLVHGEYLLTVSEEPFDLMALVGDTLPTDRSEQYVIYAVIEAMTSTIFETLGTVEEAIAEVEDDLVVSGNGSRQRRGEVIRGARARLTSMRRRIGPQRAMFERVGEEIGQVAGLGSDSRPYFERILGQLDRAVDGIDAASQAISNVLDLSLNETTYRLTMVATIFLPLTFITGFFGMNFDYLVGNIDSGAAFWLLGVGALVVSTAIGFYLLRRADAIPAPPAIRDEGSG
jgi:magnesium transporter